MKEGIEALGKILEMLAGQLGVTADYLIPLFARRAIGYATADLFCIGAIGLAWWYRVRLWGEGEDCDDADGARTARAFVGAAMLLAGIFLFSNAMGTLASPEAAAIKSILSSVGELAGKEP